MNTQNNNIVDAQDELESKDFIMMFNTYGPELSEKIYAELTAVQSAGQEAPRFKSKKELAEEAELSETTIWTYTDIVVTLSSVGINWE